MSVQNTDANRDTATYTLTDNVSTSENLEDLNLSRIGPALNERDTLEAVRMSSRPKLPTEKMKEYRRQILQRDFETARKGCTKQINEIHSLLADDATELSLLQKERGKLGVRMDDFTSAYEVLYNTFEIEEERLALNNHYDALSHKNHEALRLLSERISALQAQKDDRSSIYTSRSKQSRSSRRSRSSVESSSSLQRRAEMAAKAARLQAELKFHDVESKETATLKRQEDEVKKLQMMKELAATKAELDAISKIAENYEDVSHPNEKPLPNDDCREEQLENYLQSQLNCVLQNTASSSPLPATNTTSANYVDVKANTNVTFASGSALPKSQVLTSEEPRQCTKPSPASLNPYALPFTTGSPSPQEIPRKPCPDEKLDCQHSEISATVSTSGEDLMQRLADLLAQRQDRDSLPRPEPEVFSGDPLDYPTWKKSFETFIERKTKDPSELLYYLGKYTSGESKEAISGLLSLNSADAYKKARKILADRFGNTFIVADAYRKRINNWPKVLPNDGHGLRKFSDFLQHCLTAMNTVEYLNILNDPEENQKMIRKLPSYLVTRWSRIVDEWVTADVLEDDEVPLSKEGVMKTGYPPFAEFCNFIKREARISCNPVTSLQALKAGETNKSNPRRTNFNPRDKGNFDARTLATGSSEERENAVERTSSSNTKVVICPFCKENHELDLCVKFPKIPLPERRKFDQANALCWGCLKWGHVSKECRGRKTCNICNRRHPTSLHDDSAAQRDKEKKPEDQEKSEANCKNSTSLCIEVQSRNSHAKPMLHSLIVPVWLHHEDDPNTKIMVYALLDDQSDACFVKQATIEKLGVSGQETQLKLSTVLAEETITSRRINGLVVRGVKERTEIPLPRTYTRDIIPAKRSQIPTPETARKWTHLKRIADQLMPYKEDLDVSLLLGINCARAIKPREVIPGNDDDPYAQRTALGWGIVGMVEPGRCNCEERVDVHRIVSCEVQFEPNKMCYFALKTHTKEILSPVQVNRMFELDFTETKPEEHSFSYEDRRFLSKVNEGIHQRCDGHYEMPLPFKKESIMLPNNKEVALKRLNKLKGRLKSDSKYKADYLAFMSDIISRGHAEKVPIEEVSTKNGQVWYIPHHGVYHPKKPGKIRVVFDCSVEFAGESLNRHLLQGPDLTNNLVGVLCRFRQEPVAVMCDIEGMFHQVHVNPEHRNFLRFFWWDSGNIDSDPEEYRMTVHLFGATSSPGCANFALKKVASDFGHLCGEEAANFLKNDFYVDDGLKSVSTPEAAIALVKNTKLLCERGGFNLHKFVSNHKAVIDTIPLQDLSKDIQNLDFTKDSLPVERALGVQWCVESDALQFRVVLKDQPFTRRGILSTVSSVFDPLGLLAPLILTGKIILQELCRDGADWDDKVPEPLRMKWERWRSDLHLLSKLKVSRCFKPEGFGELKSVELHHFSDASKDAYGQCSYLRLINHYDQIHCSLAMAKSRVAPLKPVTIPRLELTAALVSVRIGAILRKELEYEQITEVFWTDSKVVIGYISNDARRFHTFVANRVQQIRDRTSPDQWKYVETELNPADDASRGLTAQNLVDSSRWWNGPDFLWKPLEDRPCPDGSEAIFLSPGDPEVKKITAMATQTLEPFSLPKRIEYFSCWHRAKRAVAVCLRLQKKFRTRMKNQNTAKHENIRTNAPKKKPEVETTKPKQSRTNEYVPVNTQELQDAEREIVKSVQRETFQKEINLLRSIVEKASQDRTSLKIVKKASTLYKMDPFVDSDGVLRVGGRLRNAEIPAAAKYPVVLPKKGHVTRLIISHYHDSIHHQGRGMTHNQIRSSGFWIVGGSSAVADFIAKCVHCRKLRGALQEQKMADLPEDRVQSAPPFSYCAVDYFGPWYIKEGRRQLKRYGVLFTCLASRAVHLEVANSLTTDSFMNAYRRFVGRRGPVRQIRSDQGTNFVGARNELQQALFEMDHEKLRTELLKRNCDWVEYKMNVPHSSHMGGAWERQIRTVRDVLTALLSSHGSQLDDESLVTFMTEAEAIVNCRPLTVDDLTSPECLQPLSPSQLLTLKSNVVLPPPGSFQRADLYSKKRWRRVQYLANEFWIKWKTGYLHSLQARQKWVNPRRNIREDDVVLVKDENLPRNQWQLARVVRTYPSDDGLVRKVKILLADSLIDDSGQRSKTPVMLERPIQKLVLLVPSFEDQPR